MLQAYCRFALRATCVAGVRRLVCGTAMLFVLSQTAFAIDQVVRVEEDWELVVATSDSNSTSPQVVTAFSPYGDVEGHYATFEVNHQSAPEFGSGGLHLQIWDGEGVETTVCNGDDTVMSSDGETVRWTQRIRLKNNQLYFSIRNGTSETWGNFGGSGTMWRSVHTSLTHLNAYNPDISVRNSGVTYGGNRVTSLVLKSVRRYLSNGQVLVDDTPRVVHVQ